MTDADKRHHEFMQGIDTTLHGVVGDIRRQGDASMTSMTEAEGYVCPDDGVKFLHDRGAVKELQEYGETYTRTIYEVGGETWIERRSTKKALEPFYLLYRLVGGR